VKDLTQAEKEARLEKARKELLSALGGLRHAEILTLKEADAVEAAIEDELILLRLSSILSHAR
jgi:hypothetical protein